MIINTAIPSRPVAQPAVRAAVQYVTVNFGTNWGTARINLLDVNNNVVAAHDVPITEAESAQWGSDDKYILTLALRKLGITP